MAPGGCREGTLQWELKFPDYLVSLGMFYNIMFLEGSFFTLWCLLIASHD